MFNVANSAISIGVVVLLLGVWWHERAAGRLQPSRCERRGTGDMQLLVVHSTAPAPQRLDRLLAASLPSFREPGSSH